MNRRTLPLLALTLASVAGAACSSGDPTSDPTVGDVAEVVAPGKTDNYASPTSREFRLWGEGTIELDASLADADDADKLARAEELLGYHLKAYSHFINVYVMDKGHDDTNADYGGFSAILRQTTEEGELEADDEDEMAWTFQWELEIGGPNNLLSRLPLERRADGERFFLLKMPALTASQLEGGHYSKIFDPDS
jgi:hypothetical protein